MKDDNRIHWFGCTWRRILLKREWRNNFKKHITTQHIQFKLTINQWTVCFEWTSVQNLLSAFLHFVIGRCFTKRSWGNHIEKIYDDYSTVRLCGISKARLSDILYVVFNSQMTLLGVLTTHRKPSLGIAN